ncbi:hypothetical protein KX729_27570 [Rhizobium sp. XQZ8]|uniref:hypothetical protein n=1 Tax=Rhizobium populisoli TaxID=2859785 RepID=UPI001CA4E2FD|nr:hypothetical protein [Rhizobium populisoli]MBW6425199.1 hypothetical protein [Rhizobium populisoli]
MGERSEVDQRAIDRLTNSIEAAIAAATTDGLTDLEVCEYALQIVSMIRNRLNADKHVKGAH